MQIGQILVEQRWVEPEALARALAEQRGTGKRICSLLIARGLLDPDNAARALANQHGVPGVLQKHLENRDHALAKLLPPAFARACFALPIGRTRTNELIICVRDPRPELRGILASAVGGPVMMAVAPAFQLEQLIKATYEPMPNPVRADASVDVDLSTRVIPTLPDVPAAPAAPAAPAKAAQRDLEEVEVDLRTRQIAVISGDLGGDGLGDLGSMTLVELDDVRVAKDPSQSGQQSAVLPRTTTTPFGAPPPQARTTTSPYGAPPRSTVAPIAPPRSGATQVSGPRTTTTQYGARATTAPARTAATNALAMVAPTGPAGSSGSAALDAMSPGTAAGPPGPTLDATIAALDRATELDDASELAMRYLAGRFHYAVLFTINEGAALGDRGHGGPLTDEVIHAITVPLAAPSTIQVAHATHRLATAAPAHAGAIQDRLERTLGNPQSVAALPIEVDDQVAYVIAVGDASGDPSGATYDLERLGRVLGAAYHRLR